MYLSVDPAQRCQMNESTGVEYLVPWQIDGVIAGLGSGVVVESNNAKFKKGTKYLYTGSIKSLQHFLKNVVKI